MEGRPGTPVGQYRQRFQAGFGPFSPFLRSARDERIWAQMSGFGSNDSWAEIPAGSPLRFPCSSPRFWGRKNSINAAALDESTQGNNTLGPKLIRSYCFQFESATRIEHRLSRLDPNKACNKCHPDRGTAVPFFHINFCRKVYRNRCVFELSDIARGGLMQRYIATINRCCVGVRHQGLGFILTVSGCSYA
jgi:hypothetical protein